MARTARSLLRSAATVAGAFTAVAGVSLAAMPAASAAEPDPFNMYDVDQNGLDPYAADTSGNGHVDQNIVTVNGALLWLYDENENWWPDSYANDSNGDGHPDLWAHDPDENGVIDSWSYDPAVFRSQPTFQPGLTLVIESQPLGTSVQDVIDTVNANGGIITDPCAFYNGMAFVGTNVGCTYARA
jgi:hypothetical protein